MFGKYKSTTTKEANGTTWTLSWGNYNGQLIGAKSEPIHINYTSSQTAWLTEQEIAYEKKSYSRDSETIHIANKSKENLEKFQKLIGAEAELKSEKVQQSHADEIGDQRRGAKEPSGRAL